MKRTIFKFGNQLLKRFPIQLKKNGKYYKIESMESLVVFYEVVIKQSYTKKLTHPIHTFIDIGCNNGIFSTYIGNGDSIGLAIDGNPKVLETTNWHIKKNNLPITVLHGAVGVKEATLFNINPSSLASTIHKFNPKSLFQESNIIKVNAIDLDKESTKIFGNTTIDLIKIDVEGAEFDLIPMHLVTLVKTRTMLLEIHKWVPTNINLESLLSSYGFKIVVLSDSVHARVIMCSK